LQPRVALPLLAACAAPAPPPSGQPAMSQCLHLLQFTSLPAQPLADGIASVPWVHRYAEASRAAQPESATRPVSVGDAEGLGVATTASLQTAWGSRMLVVERDAGRLALAAGSALQPMITAAWPRSSPAWCCGRWIRSGPSPRLTSAGSMHRCRWSTAASQRRTAVTAAVQNAYGGRGFVHGAAGVAQMRDCRARAAVRA